MGSITLLECGRVLVTSDYSLYALDCLYCKKILTQWDTFFEHIQQCKKFRAKHNIGDCGEYDTTKTLVGTAVSAADEQEVELETLMDDVVTEDNVRKQIKQLRAKYCNDEPTEEREIVAAWPIEMVKEEDIKEDDESHCSAETEDKHIDESEQNEALESEQYSDEGNDLAENAVQRDDEDNASQIDAMPDDIEDVMDYSSELDDDIDEYFEDMAASNVNTNDGINDNDIDNECSNSDDDCVDYYDDVDEECENSFVASNNDKSAEDLKISERKENTLSNSTDKKYNQYDIPSNTIHRKKDAEKQHFILSFALTPANVIKKFIAHVKAHPCLWRGNTTAYRNRGPRNDALNVISDALHITPNSVAKSVQYLLRWYAIEYQKCKSSTSDAAENKDPSQKYYAMCDFLTERMDQIIAENEKIKQQRAARHKTICQHCGKAVETLRIVAHTRRHTKNFDFMCDICKKLCQNASDLRTHMRVHTGERPYVCNTCGKRYKTSSALCGHKRMHEEPAFQCTLCPKAFHKGYILKNHMNIHLNRRPFQCEHCLKSFTSPRYLYMHMKPVLRCSRGKKTTKANS